MRAPKIAQLAAALVLLATSALAQQPTTPAAQPTRPPQTAAADAALSAPQTGPTSYAPDALYNLANSYARAGKAGLAVLNYERAALLAPNDPDINANLEYVRATAQVPVEPPTRLTRIALVAGPKSAAWLGVVGIVLLGASFLANRASMRRRGLKTIGALLGVGLIALAVSNAVEMWPRMHEAVVLLNQTPARVSPVPMGDTAFVLREAETVTISAEHEDFILVRTRTGRTGWVARASLGIVAP